MSLSHLQSFFSEVQAEPIEEHREEVQEPNKVILTAHIDRDKRNRELYKEMSSNINKSEKLRMEINKEIKANAPNKDILLMALKCISLMTGDKTFYRQNIEHLKG